MSQLITDVAIATSGADSSPRKPAEHLRVLDPAVSNSTALQAEPLVLTNFGDFSLLISSSDIHTLMPVQKMQTDGVEYGVVAVDRLMVPVFGLSKSLQLSPQLPESHTTLLVLQYQAQVFALGCNRIEKIEEPNLVFYPVPVSMSSRKQPFSRFAVMGQDAVGLASAAGLWQLLVARKLSHLAAVMQQPELIQGAI